MLVHKKNVLPEGYPRALQICVMQNSECVMHVKSGERFELFDVASLTKILVTVPLVMSLYEKKLIDLDAPLSTYLGFLHRTNAGDIVVRDLLRHKSGLIWWRPYFESLLKVDSNARRGLLQKLFQKEKRSSHSKCVYSDLDFILLGWIIESLLEMPLDEAAQLYVLGPLKMNDSLFNPPKVLKSNCAPTEVTKLRGKVQGVVHDDNAWALGGVAGHAGLFSTLEDVARFGVELLKIYQGKSNGLWKSSTVRLFCRRAVPLKGGDWALGFTLPSRPLSTGGEKISLASFGHTGFTGTSLWIDTKRNSVVTILSNRTYPSRTDVRFQKLRPRLHDEIWEMIDAHKH